MHKKICYVVLIYDNVTDLLCCLWSLWNEDHTYILAIDQKSSALCREVCESLSHTFTNVLCVFGHNGVWGGYSLMDASLKGIEAGLHRNSEWQHLCLLSGNHVGLRSQRSIREQLTEGKSYLRSQQLAMNPRPTDEEFLECQGIHRRIWGRFEEVPGLKSVMVGIHEKLPNVKFYKGSQWIALARGVCERLTLPDRLELAAFFRWSFVPDETFLHTTVRAFEPADEIVSLDTTFHRWSGSGASEMSQTDYEDATRHPHWFARKLPRYMDRSYLLAIQKSTGTGSFGEFIWEAGFSLLEGEEGEVAVAIPRKASAARARVPSGPNNAWGELIEVLGFLFGPHALTNDTSAHPLTCWIEPGSEPYNRAVIGIVRSSDCDTAWLTIKVKTSLCSPEVMARLLSADVLRDVVDHRFEETHLEPEFREFFKREHRTAYVLRMASLSRPETKLKLCGYSKLLFAAWECLSDLVVLPQLPVPDR